MTMEQTRAAARLGQPDRWWEDLQVGDTLCGPGITVTDAHPVHWAGLTATGRVSGPTGSRRGREASPRHDATPAV